MHIRIAFAFVLALAAGLASAAAVRAQAEPAEPVSFARHIRPILELKCFECHDQQERESGFLVTSVAAILQGGEGAGAAVIPGQPEASPLIEYLTGVRRPRMPKNYRPLSDEQIDLFRRWIADGARDDTAEAGTATAGGVEKAGVPRLLPSHAQAVDASAQLEAALFSDDAEQLFVLRRQIRLARLPAAAAPPASYPDSTNPIDHFIAARWRDAGLSEAAAPPAVVDDATFLRRASLDLIGVIPTAEEIARFGADQAPDKRARAVDALLARRDDYAAHWTPFWEEALGSQTTRMQGGIPTRGNYRDWIFRQLAANVPFDVFAASLIDPAMPRHKPSVEVNANGKRSKVGYVLNNTPTDTIQSAANVAQVFLGTSMKCASCHNHFQNDEWPQTRFLAFAGLFAGADLELVRCEKRTGQVVPAKFPFALPDVPPLTVGSENARLHRAALLLTDPTNPRFARAMVNRLWRRYLGLGLVEPADDFRLDRAASHPELLDWLADDFMRHGYDLTHTIRLILTSRTYQHRYDPAREDRFDVQKPDEPRYFRSPALRRLTAEQFIDSVRLITTGRLERRQRIYLDRISTALTRAMGRPASRNEISTARPEDIPVLTALELMNGPELDYLVYGSPVLAAKAALVTGTRRQVEGVVRDLYQAVVGRAPRPEEMKLARAHLAPAAKRTASEETAEKRAGRTGPPGAGPPPRDAHDEVVFDDELPADAVTEGSSAASSLTWVTGPAPLPSGTRAHAQSGEGEVTFHRVSSLPPVSLSAHDRLATWVYLDPAHPPVEIMVEWFAGAEWEHRAYWADEERPERLPEPPHRRWMGPLPQAGGWVRLEVPAGEVGLGEGVPVTGWSFVQVGGTAIWDVASVRREQATSREQALGDLLWALVSSPEFQFVH